MKETAKYYSNSEAATLEIASKLAKEIPIGSIILLEGNLGAGKTVFARGFARGLGITDIICSPTFNIVREYQCKDSRWMYHMDLYRINDSSSAMDFGIEEYLNNPNAISLIEWPDRISDILTENVIKIEIKRLNDTDREITVGFSQQAQG